MRDCVLLYNTKKTVKLFILTRKLLDNCKTSIAVLLDVLIMKYLFSSVE